MSLAAGLARSNRSMMPRSPGSALATSGKTLRMGSREVVRLPFNGWQNPATSALVFAPETEPGPFPVGITDQRTKRPATRPALFLIFQPRLLAALALEHADGAAFSGIKHGPNQLGLPTAIAAPPDRIGLETRKNFVFKLVAHGDALPTRINAPKLQSEH